MIGADGRIGSALLAALRAAGHDAIGTSRRAGAAHPLDLLAAPVLPPCDVGYICAAALRERPEVPVPHEWAVNVDGTLAVANALNLQGSFPVFLSSRAVEVRTDFYARMKRHVEGALEGTDAAVVRIGVFNAAIQRVLDTLIEVGEQRRAGLTVVGGLA